MANVVANEWVSLDGVIQAPGAPGEDTSDGFSHGGWHLSYFDDLSRKWVVDGLTAAGGFVFGRRTYETLSSYWPNASEEEQVIAEPLNRKPKYVASRTLAEPLEWQNASLLQGEVVDAVAGLKSRLDGDLHVLGSSQLLDALTAVGLVDEYRLMIDPLLVGGGKSLFPRDGGLRPLELVSSQVTTTGAILARYTRTDG